MSIIQSIAHLYLSLQNNVYVSADSIRQEAAKARPRAKIIRRLHRRCDIKIEQINGREVITLTPKNSTPSQTLLYLHGGGYVLDLMTAHWQMIDRIITKTGVRVVVPIYRLAPHSHHDDEMAFMLSLYNQCRPDVVAGDSAGGNFALMLAIYLRDLAKDLPKSLILFAPWVDLSMTNDEIDSVARHDPMLAKDGIIWCGQAWAGGRATTDPKVSPLYDHLNDLPPLHIYQGTYDILYPDVKRLADKLAHTNTPHQVHIFDKAFHVFMGAIISPEARWVFDDVAKVIKG